MYSRTGTMTGISFIDSTGIQVCHPCRAHAHKVFEGLIGWGKNGVGWHYGFKLHLVINDCGELLAFKLTPANTDDREPVPDLTKDLIGKLFGDRGYISQALFIAVVSARLAIGDAGSQEHEKPLSAHPRQDFAEKTCWDAKRSTTNSRTSVRLSIHVIAACLISW